MNLLVANSFDENAFLSISDGLIQSDNSGYITSGFIPVLSNVIYKFILYTNNQIDVYLSSVCAYDKNGQFISTVTLSSNYSNGVSYKSRWISSFPNNTKYIKCCLYMQDGEHPISYFTKEMILNTKPVLTYFRAYTNSNYYYTTTDELLERPVTTSPILITKNGQLKTFQTIENFDQVNIQNNSYINVNQLIEF